MTYSKYFAYEPQLGDRVFIAQGAKVIGRVELGDHVNIWFNSVIRADVNSIKIGKNTNIQDLCMLHVTQENSLTIGENTSLGHSVILHGCKIGNGCLIGMGALILDGAQIGDNCLVAAGSMVTPGKKFPSGSMIKGRPAILERPLTPEELERVTTHYSSYLVYKEQYLEMEKGIKPFGLSYQKKFRLFLDQISEDNLFLLSSSLSFYSAVAIAPFLLILLGVASFIGADVQSKFTNLTSAFSPELGQMVSLIFQNVNEGINLGSVSGLLGVIILFFTASLVFLQMRYSLDVIYGYHQEKEKMNIWDKILEKLFAMLVVVIAGLFLILSSSVSSVFRMIFPGQDYNLSVIVLNLLIYILMFYGIHVYTPSNRPPRREAIRMSLLTSLFFLLGNTLLGVYFRTFTLSSIYGAAATLLVFLVWSYYSAFTMFLSVEVFLYLKSTRETKFF
jgi:YihY family inner membrane protein